MSHCLAQAVNNSKSMFIIPSISAIELLSKTKNYHQQKEESNFINTAVYLHTRNTVFWKENKNIFRRLLRRVSLSSVQGGCQLK